MSRTIKIILTFTALGSLCLVWLITRDSPVSKPSEHEPEQLIIFHAGNPVVPFKEISENA